MAVTDAAGSDISHALLWSQVDEQPRSFEDDLRRIIPADDQIWRNHHQYFDVVRWASATQVLVRAWGYGDPREPFLDRLYRAAKWLVTTMPGSAVSTAACLYVVAIHNSTDWNSLAFGEPLFYTFIVHVAAIWGDLRAVELLLHAGADIEMRGDLAR